MTRTRDGSLWVATIGGGLNRMLPGNEGFQRFRHDPENPASLADDAILTLYEDRAGTLWIGTRDHGFDELCAGCSTFVHHPHSPTKAANGLAPGSESIWAISSSVNGELWLGSLIGGLERYTLATG
ncbi:MAG TPA: two-component regulator propeller domain-containing protein, partial [Dokdonella sp.]|nr:two-component regulator propeller domain-containing protein [Dokdonella sp.]